MKTDIASSVVESNLLFSLSQKSKRANEAIKCTCVTANRTAKAKNNRVQFNPLSNAKYFFRPTNTRPSKGISVYWFSFGQRYCEKNLFYCPPSKSPTLYLNTTLCRTLTAHHESKGRKQVNCDCLIRLTQQFGSTCDTIFIAIRGEAEARPKKSLL